MLDEYLRFCQDLNQVPEGQSQGEREDIGRVCGSNRLSSQIRNPGGVLHKFSFVTTIVAPWRE